MVTRLRFAKLALDALPNAEKGRRVVVYDSKVPKLALRVTDTGAKAFYVVRRKPDGVDWIRLGAFPDMSVEQAQKAAHTALGAYARGDSPADAKRAQRAMATLGDAFDTYVDDHLIPRGAKTVADVRALWERCIGKMPETPTKRHGRPRTKHPGGVDWSVRKANTIDARDVRALHTAIGRTHPTMANRVVELLSAVYGHAQLGVNPAAGIKAFKETKRDRFIQSDELPKFFVELANDASIDFKHFVLLALLTGARRTNVLAMRWEEVSFDRATWRIPDSKNGEPVVVPLVAEAIEVLTARGPEKTGWVFPAESKTGYIVPPKKRWRALLVRAGIEDLRIHDLRRSLGSWQAITGASLTIIGKSLGHKSADATMIYSRLSMDPVRASVTTATSAMLEAAGVKKPAKVTSIRRKKTAA